MYIHLSFKNKRVLKVPREQRMPGEHVVLSVSDRRGSGKPRPKSEGFELYSNSAPNGSPESPPLPWAEYSEPKKLPGDDRLLKNRADHRSSPNVASKSHRPSRSTPAHARPTRGPVGGGGSARFAVEMK